MKILILEDDENRVKFFKQNLISHSLYITEYVKDCIDQLKKETYDIIFLDHDLGGNVYVQSGGDEETGFDVARWMSENQENLPKLAVVHSLNPQGRQNILAQISKTEMLMADAPFIWQDENLSENLEKIFN